MDSAVFHAAIQIIKTLKVLTVFHSTNNKAKFPCMI